MEKVTKALFPSVGHLSLKGIFKVNFEQPTARQILSQSQKFFKVSFQNKNNYYLEIAFKIQFGSL